MSGAPPLPPEFLDLRRGYLREALGKAEEIERLAARLAGDALPPEATQARQALRQVAHRLRGSGGFYGFAAIGDAAAALEDAIEGGCGADRLADLAATLAEAIRAARA